MENRDNGYDNDAADLMEHEQLKRAYYDLDAKKRGDGILQMSEAQLGVLQKVATAVLKDTEYRQALLLANFLSPEEADRAVNAIAFSKRYGGTITPIVDKIIARCAVKGARVDELINALTSMRLTTNYSRSKSESNSSRSPING